MSFTPLILQSLETMRLGEMSKGEVFKAVAYKKACDAIRRMEKPIHVVEDVKGVHGIGVKIYEKIQEIIETGGLRAAERMKEATNVDSFDLILKIHGVGPVKARELIAMGIKSIEDVRRAFKDDPTLLNETQQTGLRFYEAGIQRIPRTEMVEHEKRLFNALPAGLTGTIVGSYRRGAPDSGDVDMLVMSHEDTKKTQKVFNTFVDELTKSGYVVAKLAGGAKKWMGYIQLRGDSTPRRLDLLLTPSHEFPFALLYFTGSDKFNVAFRQRCLSLGYTLNEHGIQKKDLTKADPPTIHSEKDIFDFVGLTYFPPAERLDSTQIVLA